jgi:fatty-acid peroxygenase
MRDMPRAPGVDSTLSLRRDPYQFISRTAERLGTNVFAARILFHPTICMTGQDAARLFYDEDRFERAGAPPLRLQPTLLGREGVQALDGPMHELRKAMFRSLMTPPRIADLGDLVEAQLHRYAQKWNAMDRIALYPELRELLCRAVCAWAGVPLEEDEVAQRTHQLTALFEHAGEVGPSHWGARLARWRSEHWAQEWIEAMRAGKLDPPARSALRVIARHRDADGQLLAPRTAAVELLNVLRPTVAVAVYLTDIAHALHAHPDCREGLERGGDRYLDWFVQEVRRFYPFFPSAVARVRHAFEWDGWRFPRGWRALLDLHGIDHDPRIWGDAESFRPERFGERLPGVFELVPQGGGDPWIDHRCAGELITIELMKRTARFLVREVAYDVPEQDLRVDERRPPALPRSRFVVSRVRTRVREVVALG